MRMVPDTRCRRKKKHDQAEVLTCIVIGFLMGRTTLRRSLGWCRRHQGQLKERMELANGIASVPTACRMLWDADEYLFALAFMEWIGEILSTKGIHLVIDGKALRAAVSKVRNSRTPMVMNVLDAATGLVLAQLPIQDKECEISGIPQLLELLDIRGSTVTIDAIGTTTDTMHRIVRGGGHFVFTVKKNNPVSYEEIRKFFEELETDSRNSREKQGYTPKYPDALKTYEETQHTERNRDRYEYRYYKICGDPSCLTKVQKEWPFIKSVGSVRQVRIPVERDDKGNDTTPDLETFIREGSRRRPRPSTVDAADNDIQSVGIVSDRVLTADGMGKIKRDHWLIENRLHHVLDDTFREDRSPAKKSKNNLALIRKFAYNILRIAMMEHRDCKTMTDMMDNFADDPSYLEKYVFNGIESFY